MLLIDLIATLGVLLYLWALLQTLLVWRHSRNAEDTRCRRRSRCDGPLRDWPRSGL